MIPSSPRNLRRFSALLGAALLLAAVQADALQIPEELKKKFLEGAESGAAMGPESMDKVIDNSIDPDTYMVGGGDGFFISIVGLPSQKYYPVIGADGNIYEGDLGIIKLGRVSLRKAEEAIGKRVRTALKRDYEVRVSLTRIKTPVVTINGAVESPGTYSVPGTRRLLDVIKMAHANTVPPIQNFDLRQVSVKGLDSTRSYDLLRYISRGDLSQNPYVYPGDNINVSAADARVYVSGEALGPVTGWVPVKAGETVAGMLDVIRIKGTADAGRVLLQQAAPDSKVGTLSLTLGEAAATPLRDGDMLTIPMAETRRRLDTAVVSGEVLRPGTFPITIGVTTAEELLRQAGGPTALANPGRAYLLRASKIITANRNLLDESDRTNALLRKQAAAYVQNVRPEVGSSFMEMKSNGDFAIIEIGKGAAGIRVEEGDRLHIPRKEQFVYVSGNVANPGAYPYQPGKRYSHYVKLAGGYSARSDTKNMFAVGVYEGVNKIKDVDLLGEGDILVVPSSIEYKTYQAVYLPLLQIVPAVLSLVVSILILTDQP